MTYRISEEFMTAIDEEVYKAMEAAPVFRNGISISDTDFSNTTIKYRTITGVSTPTIMPPGTMAVDIDDIYYSDTYVRMLKMKMGFHVSSLDMAAGAGYAEYYNDVVREIVEEEAKVEDKIIGDGWQYTPTSGSATYIVSGMYGGASLTQAAGSGTWGAGGNPYDDVRAALSQMSAYGINPSTKDIQLFLTPTNAWELKQRDTMGHMYETFVNEVKVKNIYESGALTANTGLLATKGNSFARMLVSQNFEVLEPFTIGSEHEQIDIAHTFGVYLKEGNGFCKLTGL